MEAKKTNLNSRLPSRHVTEGQALAPHRSIADTFDLAYIAEVFKRTPYLPDSKSSGQFIAKDLFEADDIPLLMKTLLDSGFLTSGIAGLRGKRAPNGAGVKVVAAVIADDLFADAERGSLDVQLSDAEFEERRAAWQQPELAFGPGFLWKYSRQVGAARHGAVTRPDGLAEKMCYADI